MMTGRITAAAETAATRTMQGMEKAENPVKAATERTTETKAIAPAAERILLPAAATPPMQKQITARTRAASHSLPAVRQSAPAITCITAGAGFHIQLRFKML